MYLKHYYSTSKLSDMNHIMFCIYGEVPLFSYMLRYLVCLNAIFIRSPTALSVLWYVFRGGVFNVACTPGCVSQIGLKKLRFFTKFRVVLFFYGCSRFVLSAILYSNQSRSGRGGELFFAQNTPGPFL